MKFWAIISVNLNDPSFVKFYSDLLADVLFLFYFSKEGVIELSLYELSNDFDL